MALGLRLGDPRAAALGLVVLASLLVGSAPSVAEPPPPPDLTESLLDRLNLRIDGYLENNTAYRLFTPHVFQKVQSQLELGVELRPHPSLRLRALGRAIWDPRGRLVERVNVDEEPIDRWQIGGSRRAEAELRELTVDWRGEVGRVQLDVRLGKQQIVWGQAFGLRVLDAVNAFDFREFILDDFFDARIAVFGGRVDAYLEGWSLQAFALPDFEPDLIPLPRSEFQPNFANSDLVPAVSSIEVEQFFDEFSTLRLAPARQPDDWKADTLAFGFRVGRHYRGWDIFLHYLDAYDSAATLRRDIFVERDPNDLIDVPFSVLTPTYKRIHAVGYSVATARGDFGFWSEGLFAFERGFALDDRGPELPLVDDEGMPLLPGFTQTPTTDKGFVRRTDLRAVVGIDYLGVENLFVNFQWIPTFIFGDTSLVKTDRWRNFLSLLLRYEALNQTLIPQLFVLYGVNDTESMIRPSLEWRLTDNLSVVVGADVFTGPSGGLLGEFGSRLDCNFVPPPIQQQEGLAQCLPEIGDGKPSRGFLRVRYAFELEL